MIVMASETGRCRHRNTSGRVCHFVSKRPGRCHRSPVNGPKRHDVVGRYYDPATGLFLDVDPKVQETQQTYSYASDNPVTNTDPSGTAAKEPCRADGKTTGCANIRFSVSPPGRHLRLLRNIPSTSSF